MSHEIAIRFEIPFSGCVFWGWLPLAAEDAIVVKEGELILAVRFVEDYVLSFPGEPVRVAETNNSFRRVVALVTIRDVPDPFIASIHQGVVPTNGTDDSPHHLAHRALKVAISRVNRVISYARNVKGQY